MIKVFTTDKDGKIRLTADELKNLLDEAYWDGYRAHNMTYTYSTPDWRSPYVWTNTADCISVANSDTAANTITTGSNLSYAEKT